MRFSAVWRTELVCGARDIYTLAPVDITCDDQLRQVMEFVKSRAGEYTVHIFADGQYVCTVLHSRSAVHLVLSDPLPVNTETLLELARQVWRPESESFRVLLQVACAQCGNSQRGTCEHCYECPNTVSWTKRSVVFEA